MTASFKARKFVVFLTVCVDFIGFGLILPLLTRYAEDFGAGGVQIGILFLSYSLMQMLVSPWWGRLSDKWGRKPILMISIGGNAISLALAAMADSYAWLLMARLLSGFLTSNVAVAAAYIADLTEDDERSVGMGWIGAARGIGFVLGPIIGGELSVFGIAAPFWGAAGLALLNFVAAVLILPETAAKKGAPLPQGFWQNLKQMRRDPLFEKVLAIAFVQVIAFSMLEMAYVLFIERRFELSPVETTLYAGRVFTFIGVVLALVQGVFLKRLVRVFSEANLLRSGIALVFGAMILIPLTSMGDWPFFLIATAMAGAGQALIAPTLLGFVSRLALESAQGSTLGAYQSVQSLARVIGPLGAGLLFDFAGENAPYQVAALLTAWTLWRAQKVSSPTR